MDIYGIFKRAWEISWKHKGLWVLGILANCSSGGGQGSSNATRIPEYRVSAGEFHQLERWLESIPIETWVAIGIGAFCAMVLVVLIFWVLTAIGNGGLIAGFQMAETGEAVTLASTFQQGLNIFWKLLAIQFILGLASLIVIAPIIIGAVLMTILTFGIGVICLLPLICLLVPLSIAISIYTLLTQIALIVEDLDIVDAFQRAWEVFRLNLGQVIVMGLILGVGGFVVSLILAVPFVMMVLPFVAGLILGTDTSSLAGFWATMIGVLLYLPVLLVAGGIMRTFITGSWTLTYRSLIGAKAA